MSDIARSIEEKLIDEMESSAYSFTSVLNSLGVITGIMESRLDDMYSTMLWGEDEEE